MLQKMSEREAAVAKRGKRQEARELCAAVAKRENWAAPRV